MPTPAAASTLPASPTSGLMPDFFIGLVLGLALGIFLGIAALRARHHRLQAARPMQPLPAPADSAPDDDGKLPATAQNRFIVALGHDLQQPLHAQRLFIDELARLCDTEEARTLLQRIEGTNRTMSERLRNLRDLARLEAGSIVPERAPIDLPAFFAQLASTHTPAAEAAGVRLQFLARPLRLESDPALLARLLGRLIGNAIRFTDGTVLVAARRRAGALRIEIRDNGLGIPADDARRIIAAFQQLARRRDDPGIAVITPDDLKPGLGLAVTLRIARLLDADLQLRSAPGAGSTFAVTLPCRHDAAPPVAADSAPRLVFLGKPGDLSGRLQGWGYAVEFATDAADAAQLLGAAPGILLVLGDGGTQPPGIDALLDAHRGILVSPAGSDTPAREAYHLHEPVRPARLRALLRSLH